MPPPTNCVWNMWLTLMKMCIEREQLRELLAKTEAVRKPALRRSNNEEFLFATNLPLITKENELTRFLSEAQSTGWTCRIESGWLLLDKVPDEKIIIAERSTEAEACAAILERHSIKADGRREWRILYKACEQDEKKVSEAFMMLHAEMALALREHRKLPDLQIRWKEND